jgi:hypothetical protein
LSLAKEKKLLITGCGRSGTLYSARLFSELGLDILHELDPVSPLERGKDGYASWFLAVDDPNPPQGPSGCDKDFEHILHQVRHPLLVIASFAQFILQKGSKSPEFIEKYIADFKTIAEDSQLNLKQRLILQAALYWYEWNLIALEKATDTVQLEKFEEELPRLCDMFEIGYSPDIFSRVSSRTNERKIYIEEEPWTVSWEELQSLDPVLTEKIRALAVSFGYTV